MADKSQTGTLEDDEFVLFYKMLTQRDDVMRVFQAYSGDGQKLSLGDLEDFLREEQLEAEEVTCHAARLVQLYEPSDAGEPSAAGAPPRSVDATPPAAVERFKVIFSEIFL